MSTDLSEGAQPVALERLAWHYTTLNRFILILAEGEIRAATAGVPANERPIVWFSLNQYWERSSRKALRKPDGQLIGLDMNGTSEHGGGLIRIGVIPERAPHTWRELRQLAGVRDDIARGLVRDARRDGADPREWRGTLDPVRRSDWCTVETFVDAAWVTVDLEGDVPESAEPD